MSDIQRYPGVLPLPFSRAVRAGGFLFLSGQIPLDAQGKLVVGDFVVQAQAVMDRIGETLSMAGAGFADVVKATVWLDDLGNLEQFNAVYQRCIGADLPARSAVQAKLAFNVAVEVKMQAWLGN